MLSLRYSGRAERPEHEVRWLDPPVHVELTISPTLTELALLRMWAREAGGWYGYVSYVERHQLGPGRWAHSSALRPLSGEESEALNRESARSPRADSVTKSVTETS